MGRLLKIGVFAGAIGWLHSIGALDPRLWIATVKHEREALPAQIKEALEAGKRAAAQAEADLDREVQAAFQGTPPPAA